MHAYAWYERKQLSSFRSHQTWKAVIHVHCGIVLWSPYSFATQVWSESLGEREMQLQATVSTAFLNSPNLSQVFL